MLARVRHAKVVLADVKNLQLAERFDVVLLASHLINTPDPAQRGPLLATVTRHLSPAERALIEWHPPAWFDQLEPGRTYAGTIGDLRVTSLKDGLLTAVVTYRSGAQSWTHTFAARRLDLAGLRVQMRGAGLILSGPLAGAPQWLHVTSQRRSARRGLYGALGFSQPNPSCDPSALLPPPAHAWSGWRPVEQEVPDGSQPCGARGDLCRCG